MLYKILFYLQTIVVCGLSQKSQENNNEFTILSEAIRENKQIPAIYTAINGKEISPPLKWFNPPELTMSYVLICEDIDAPIIGKITHWILYNIPSNIKEIPEDIPEGKWLNDGIIQGRNFYLKNSYMGPNPPFGRHRYVFSIYAMDCILNGKKVLSKRQILKKIKSNCIGKAQLTATFKCR